MKKIVNKIKNIIINNPNDLPLGHVIINDIITLEKKKRYYIEKSIIELKTFNISIIKIKKDFYKGFFIFEKKVNTEFTCIIKDGEEITPITSGEYDIIESMWFIKNKNYQKQKIRNG